MSMAMAWSGMSGRDQASGAGERSSVLISPVTLNTVRVTVSLSFGRSRNHLPSDQLLITFLAFSEPFSARAATLSKESKIRMVFESASAAVLPSFGSSRRSMSAETL